VSSLLVRLVRPEMSHEEEEREEMLVCLLAGMAFPPRGLFPSRREHNP
jgi:hypothetical protein